MKKEFIVEDDPMKEVLWEGWKEFAGIFLGVIVVCALIGGCAYLVASAENWKSYALMLSIGTILGLFGIMSMNTPGDEDKSSVIEFPEDPEGAGLRLTLHTVGLLMSIVLVLISWFFLQFDPIYLVGLFGAGAFTVFGVLTAACSTPVKSQEEERAPEIPVVGPWRDENGVQMYSAAELAYTFAHSGNCPDGNRGNWVERVDR